MEDPCEVPDLLNMFTKIVCDRKDYCYICLRTRDERRLMKPESLNKFMTAVKISTIRKADYVCHICERQATNALKLFRAAVFASSLNRILAELSRRDIPCSKMMLETKYFQRVLAKVQLSKNLTPKTINEEMRTIRNDSLLSETEILVMDNKQVDINNIRRFQDNPIPSHIERGYTSELPERLATLEKISGNESFPPTETQLILDEEDDTLYTTNSINVEKGPEENRPQVNENVLTAVANQKNNLVITLDPPNLITFEELQEMLNQKRIKDKKLLLHPIFLNENGEMKVPSLCAVIENDLLIFQDELKQSLHFHPLKVNMDIVTQCLKGEREVFIQGGNKFKMPAVNSNLINLVVDKSCVSDMFMYPQKKMKIDKSTLVSENVKGSPSKTSNSKSKKVQNNNRSVDKDEVSRCARSGDMKTDWEDKIPMDVITFVDAVDPNAHQFLGDAVSNPPDKMKVGNVQSLADDRNMVVDVIDLC